MSNPTGRNADSIICPRCTGFIPNDETPGAYPGATSRTDNTTEVCSSCGSQEGMESFVNGKPMPQEMWACNRDTSRDWNGPDLRINELINTHPNKEAITAYLRDSGLSGTADDFDSFRDSFMGVWSSVEECVENYLEETGVLSEVPKLLRYYIAFDRLAYDMLLTDLYTIDSENGDRWVFRYQ
jgi:hypothetical protein